MLETEKAIRKRVAADTRELKRSLSGLTDLVEDLWEQVKEPKCKCGEHLICPVCQADEIDNIEESAKQYHEDKREAED